MDLVDRSGRRLSLTVEERLAFLDALDQQPRSVRTFGLVLAYTGCRLSEALALTGAHVDFEARCLVFETLKKRQGRREFSGRRLVGRCRKAPNAHVFSFDHETRWGRFLR